MLALGGVRVAVMRRPTADDLIDRRWLADEVAEPVAAQLTRD